MGGLLRRQWRLEQCLGKVRALASLSIDQTESETRLQSYMGIASYREDLLAAFWEGEPTALPRSTKLQCRCPFCGLDFVGKKDLSAHLSLAHRGERPVLLIAGREPESDATIRQSIGPDDVTVENCTLVRISRSGVPLRGNSPDTLRALLCDETNTVLEVDLMNRFETSADPISQFYRLSVRVPGKLELDAVDRDFVRLLASNNVHLSDIDYFLSRPSTQGVVREYADALGAYVRGVLVKDGRGGSTLPFSEGGILYGKALEILQSFRRPLPIVICSLVRLASNDFTLAREKTGFDRLDYCYAILAPTLGHSLPNLTENQTRLRRTIDKTVPLCPIDETLDTILTLAALNIEQQQSLAQYLRATEHPRLTGQDRAKIYVLLALAALQLNAAFEAREALRLLRNVYPFEAWATRELNTLEG